jgi:hypothetical protein
MMNADQLQTALNWLRWVSFGSAIFAAVLLLISTAVQHKLLAAQRSERQQAQERQAKRDAEQQQREESLKSQLDDAQKKVGDLQAQLADRHLEPEQRASLVQALSTCPKGKIILTFPTQERELLNLIDELENVFLEAGFPKPVRELTFIFTMDNPPPFRLGMLVHEEETPNHAGPIQMAFEKVGIEVPGLKIPGTRGRDTIIEKGTVRFYIGTK